jgi:hypothetical protein
MLLLLMRLLLLLLLRGVCGVVGPRIMFVLQSAI